MRLGAGALLKPDPDYWPKAWNQHTQWLQQLEAASKKAAQAAQPQAVPPGPNARAANPGADAAAAAAAAAAAGPNALEERAWPDLPVSETAALLPPSQCARLAWHGAPPRHLDGQERGE